MILVVDAGNTHIEVGLFLDGQFLASWRIATGVNRTEDELMAFLTVFLQSQNASMRDVQDIAISSVVPHITQVFLKLSKKYFRITPMLVDHTLDLGMKVLYEPPSSVGADRLCNAVAFKQKYGAPGIVVDFGTATTFDVINEQGDYLGGIIASGLETTAWGLHERASLLPKIALEFPSVAIGRNTQQSMQAGIMWGTVKMVDGLIEMIQSELGRQTTVVATGGLAGIIAPRSQFIQHVEPNLVLEGIVWIYRRNRNEKI